MRIFLILTWDNLKNSLRTKKALIFLALYLLVFGMITYLFFQLQAEVELQIKDEGVSDLQRSFLLSFGESILAAETENSPVVSFLFSVPLINVVLFFVSLIGTPILLFIINYDKISQEIYDGTIRYILFRATRLQIFAAKFISSILESSLITFLALFLGVLWGSLRFESVDFALSMDYGIRYWAISQFFLATFVAFSLMSSAMFKKPFTALVVCFGSYILMAILPFMVKYLSPYDSLYFHGLFFHNSLTLLWSLLSYTIFTLIFLVAGYKFFKKTDL